MIHKGIKKNIKRYIIIIHIIVFYDLLEIFDSFYYAVLIYYCYYSSAETLKPFRREILKFAMAKISEIRNGQIDREFCFSRIKISVENDPHCRHKNILGSSQFS